MQLPLVGKVKNPVLVITGIAVVSVIMLSVVGGIVRQRIAAKNNLEKVTVTATNKDVTVEITANGTIVAVNTVNLSPKVAGRVAELLVEQGDRVKAGQLIARMENNDLEAQRVQAAAAVAQAQARLNQLLNGTRIEEITRLEASIQQAIAQKAQAQSRLQLAQNRADRNQTLYQEGAIARDNLDGVMEEQRSAAAGLDQAIARIRELDEQLRQLQNGARPEEIDLAQAQVDEAQGRLQAINTQIEESYIRAPFAGIITQKYAVKGAIVAPTTSASNTSSATSTSVVALANGMEVLANVPEVDIGQIKLGQTVEIRADAYPDQVFRGKVRLIAPAAVQEQNVTSFQVRVSLVTGQDKLRTGMNSDLVFIGQTLSNALVVPTVAIVTQDGKTGVFVPKGTNEVTFVPVTIGPSIGTETQILKGLAQGDRLFIDLPKQNRPTEAEQG